MPLQELESGQAFTLEVNWGSLNYEIQSRVMGSNANGLLIKPFVYKGIALDLMSSQYKDMLFSIHSLNLQTERRIVWKNVNVRSVIYNEQNYYVVQVNAFQNQSSCSERRDHIRLKLNLIGQIAIDRESDYFPVRLRDISDNGISFYLDDGFDIENRNIYIHFEDVVRGNVFDLDIVCRMVREVPSGNQVMYGCKIVESGKDMLAYVCLRRMVMQALKRK